MRWLRRVTYGGLVEELDRDADRRSHGRGSVFVCSEFVVKGVAFVKMWVLLS